jgi:MFS family permease
MADLSEAYGASHARGLRLWCSLALFGTGAIAVALGVLAATTELFTASGMTVFGARRLAGVLAGIGIPTAFLGVVGVLPTHRRASAVALVGASIGAFGVGLFWYAYSSSAWIADVGVGLRLPVLAVYAFGVLLTVAAIFSGLATLKRRSDPGGTARLRVTETGRVELVTADNPTLRDQISSSADAVSDGGTASAIVSSVTGGHDAEVMSGSAGARGASTPSTDGAEVMGEGGTEDAPTRIDDGDRYCGNCEHFEYVQSDQGLQPFCGHDNTVMDDMEPCEAWSPNERPDTVVE